MSSSLDSNAKERWGFVQLVSVSTRAESYGAVLFFSPAFPRFDLQSSLSLLICSVLVFNYSLALQRRLLRLAVLLTFSTLNSLSSDGGHCGSSFRFRFYRLCRVNVEG